MKKLILLILMIGSLSRVNGTDSINSQGDFNIFKLTKDTLVNKVNDSILIDIPLESESLRKVVVMNNSDDNLWVLVGLPIFTLLLGIAIPLVIEWLSKRVKSRKVLKRWVAELRCLESPMQKQVEANEKFIAEQSEQTFEISAPTIYSVLDCNIFQTMDKGEFLQAIESIKKIDYKEAVKISNSTHGYINILIHTYGALWDKFHKYLNETSGYVSVFNDHFDDLLKAYADYSVELEKETGEDPYKTNKTFQKITDLFSSHVMPKMERGDYNPFELETMFFRPLIVALSEIRLDERIAPMKHSTSKCIRAIKAIRMEHRYVAVNMQNVAEKYKIQLRELSDVMQPLENKKLIKKVK